MNHASRWTIDRSTYIGGSEIAAVVGLHPTRNGLDVWAAKVDGFSPEVGPEAELGLAYEGPTAEVWARRVGVADGDLRMLGTLVDPEAEWAGATPDRVRTVGEGQVENIQIKIVGQHAAHRWGRPDQGAEAVPVEVLAQVAWEARAIERATGLVVVENVVVANVGGTDLRTYRFPFDRELAALLFDAAREWWESYVLTGEMPEITDENAESARAILAHRYPRDVLPKLEPGHVHLALAREYAAARGAAKAADDHLEACAARLTAAIGDSIGFESDDERVRVTWKANKKGTRSLRVEVE